MGEVVPRCGAGLIKVIVRGSRMSKESCEFAQSVVVVACVSRRHVQVLISVWIRLSGNGVHGVPWVMSMSSWSVLVAASVGSV